MMLANYLCQSMLFWGLLQSWHQTASDQFHLRFIRTFGMDQPLQRIKESFQVKKAKSELVMYPGDRSYVSNNQQWKHKFEWLQLASCVCIAFRDVDELGCRLQGNCKDGFGEKRWLLKYLITHSRRSFKISVAHAVTGSLADPSSDSFLF